LILQAKQSAFTTIVANGFLMMSSNKVQAKLSETRAELNKTQDKCPLQAHQSFG